MKHECKVCQAQFVTRSENNFYCKSCTRDIQQKMTLQIEAAIAKEKAFRLEYAKRIRDRMNRPVQSFPRWGVEEW